MALPKVVEDVALALTNAAAAQTAANAARATADAKLALSGGAVTGNLTVGGQNVVRSINGEFFADANGDLALETSAGLQLIRYTE